MIVQDVCGKTPCFTIKGHRPITTSAAKHAVLLSRDISNQKVHFYGKNMMFSDQGTYQSVKEHRDTNSRSSLDLLLRKHSYFNSTYNTFVGARQKGGPLAPRNFEMPAAKWHVRF